LGGRVQGESRAPRVSADNRLLRGIVEPDGTAAAPPENSDNHFLPLQEVMPEMSSTLLSGIGRSADSQI
jgi:hypothetical protein